MTGRGRILAVGVGWALLICVASVPGARAAELRSDPAGPPPASADPHAVVALGEAVADGAASEAAPRQTAETVALGVWRASQGRPLPIRVAQVRRAVRERGVPDVEPLARLLLLDLRLGAPLDRAVGATLLAPDLPAAHAALARERLVHAHDLLGAAAALSDGLRALPGHLDALLWLGAALGPALVWALALAGLGFVALVALRHVREAAHDLGDAFERAMPGYARAALLAALVLAPAALGQGLLGVGLSLFVLAVAYGRSRARVALLAAAALVLVAIHPASERVGRLVAAPGADPIAEAAWGAERGYMSALARVRLEEAAASGDVLALRALAAQARRAGDLDEADARYAQALAAGTESASLLNNAGNVRLALGDAEGAISLLRRAAERSDSPIAWFNLAQAYGRAIRVEAHAAALERAQRLDERRVRELTQDLASSDGLVLRDLPLDARDVLPRMLEAGQGDAAARALRRPIAPGRLGASPWTTAVAFGLCGLLGLVLGGHAVRSRRCERCAELLCPRCRPDPGGGLLCAACTRMATQPDTIAAPLREQHAARVSRTAARRARLAGAAAWLVPGAGALARGRGTRALLAWLVVCVTLAVAVLPPRLAPDPFSVGLLPEAVLAGALLGVLAAQMLVAFAQGAWRRRGRA